MNIHDHFWSDEIELRRCFYPFLWKSWSLIKKQKPNYKCARTEVCVMKKAADIAKVYSYRIDNPC